MDHQDHCTRRADIQLFKPQRPAHRAAVCVGQLHRRCRVVPGMVQPAHHAAAEQALSIQRCKLPPSPFRSPRVSGLANPVARARAHTHAQWAKSSAANPGCNISYYIGTNNGNQNLKTLATISSTNLRPAWTQSTGFYDATTITDLTLNVRWTCTGSSARTYYVDDLSLKTTP